MDSVRVYITAPYHLSDREGRLFRFKERLNSNFEELGYEAIVTWTNPGEKYNLAKLTEAELVILLEENQSEDWCRIVSYGVANEIKLASDMEIPVFVNSFEEKGGSCEYYQMNGDIHQLSNSTTQKHAQFTVDHFNGRTFKALCKKMLDNVDKYKFHSEMDEYDEELMEDLYRSYQDETNYRQAVKIQEVSTQEYTSKENKVNLRLIASRLF